MGKHGCRNSSSTISASTSDIECEGTLSTCARSGFDDAGFPDESCAAFVLAAGFDRLDCDVCLESALLDCLPAFARDEGV